MDCPYCQSAYTIKIIKRTQLGYMQYCCGFCGKQYNERTGTKLNYIEHPTEIAMM